ncbi:hypothetical protein BH10ACI2_BH10ACI2_18010 [soil metagenome]
MKITLLILLTVVAGAVSIGAQVTDGVAAKKAEMKKLEKMAGQWKGSGWIQQGPNRETFTGGEMVQTKLDGLALLVEGNFKNPEGKVIHQTMAVLNCNEKLSGFDFATYLMNGMGGVHDFKVVGDHFEWGFQIPNVGTVRYTIKISDTNWSEIGEFSRDGKTWMQNFEMKLDRVK